MDTDGYNGWKNYETWCVNLWLSNDEGLYDMTSEAVKESWEEHEDRVTVAYMLKDMVDELAEMTCPGSREGASFVADLLGAALSEVDWYEIADAWISEWLETATQ